MGNKKSAPARELSEAQIRLLELNTGLSRHQIQNWYAEFLRDFPDGSIDKKEFVTIFKKTYPNANPEKYAQIAFGAFDDDKSGKITFDEFLLSTSFVTNGSQDREKSLEFAFDIYDKDNNGKITPKELQQVLTAIYEMTGQGSSNAKARVQQIFGGFDTDGDKSLDKYEFINFMVNDPAASQAFGF